MGPIAPLSSIKEYVNRHFLLLPLALALGGCAAPSLYQWGGYERALYESYKDPTKTEALRISLEQHVSQLEKVNQKAPPGIYAELGTIYLQAGSLDKAIAMYTKERDVWPESRGLMSALIENIGRRQQARGETKP